MNHAEPLFASGENYDVRIEACLARIRVWRRPDLSFERGAALAEEMSQHLFTLARGGDARVEGILFDLREAPPLIGKRTRAVMAQAADTCERSRVRLAFLGATDAQCTILRLAIGPGHDHVDVFIDERLAVRWACARGAEA